MAVNPIYRSNPIRMMGMASGMDTESIIQATLRMHQFKIDKQMRSKQLIEWKQQIHNDVKTQISTLRDTYLRSLGSKSLMNRNAFNANLATMTSASGNPVSAVSVSATSSASTGSLVINRVLSLAKGASYTSSGQVSGNGNGFTSGQTLDSMEFFGGGKINFDSWKTSVVDVNGNTTHLNMSKEQIEALSSNPAAWGDEYTTGTINGNKLTISRTDDGAYTWSQLNGAGVEIDYGKIEFDGEGKATFYRGDANQLVTDNYLLGIGDVSLTKFNDGVVKISVTDHSDSSITVLSETTMSFGRDSIGIIGDNGEEVKLVRGADGSVGNNGNALSFVGETNITINDKTINLKSNMTLTEMLGAVNNSGAGVTLSYDRMQDSFKLENKTVGSSLSSINIGTDSASANFIALLSGSNPGGPIAVEGTKARVQINGGAIEEYDSNVIDFRGVTIRLLEETTDAVTVTVKRDTDKAVDAIKDFLESYNSLIRKLEGLLNDRKTSQEAGYTPLTDEEKATMTEKQIEEWEAIAKKGILRSDTGIQNLVSSLRASFFEQIEGTGMSASQLGLTTGPWNGNTGGQIILTEEGEAKLRAALEQDPDRVADVFIKIDNSTPGQPKGTGLLYKLDKLLGDYTSFGGRQANTLDALERSLKEENDRIAKLQERMWAEEDKLYRQFAAMETALSQMQSQGDWFSAMLGAK